MLKGLRLGRDGTRSYQIKRVIKIMVKISQRPYTSRELAEEFKVSAKTIERDLRAIEAIGVPVRFDKEYNDNAANEYIAGSLSNRYSIERHWMRRFL